MLKHHLFSLCNHSLGSFCLVSYRLYYDRSVIYIFSLDLSLRPDYPAASLSLTPSYLKFLHEMSKTELILLSPRLHPQTCSLSQHVVQPSIHWDRPGTGALLDVIFPLNPQIQSVTQSYGPSSLNVWFIHAFHLLSCLLRQCSPQLASETTAA